MHPLATANKGIRAALGCGFTATKGIRAALVCVVAASNPYSFSRKRAHDHSPLFPYWLPQ